MNKESNNETKEFPEVRGVVFALNEALGFGYIRLPDSRRAKFLIKDFQKNGEMLLRLGQPVDFTFTELEGELLAQPIPIENTGLIGGAVLEEPDQKTLFELSNEFDALDIDTATIEPPSPTTTDSFYQLAIVARAENRINDARALFEKALAASPSPNVYSAYAKMELEKGNSAKAAELVNKGLIEYPTIPVFFVMKGKLVRQEGRDNEAASIFREGLSHTPQDVILRQALARVLADIGSAASFREANELFKGLERDGKVNAGDQAYQRFRALRNSPRAARAYRFFDNLPGFRVGIPGKRDNPEHITDLILEVNNPELEATFGLVGAYILRCYDKHPHKKEIQGLLAFLRSQTSQSVIGLVAGKEVSINTSLAFVVVPGTGAVRDQFMSVLSENNEALIPLDDGNLVVGSARSLESLRQLLAQFLGSRDLYLSTLPVSGRRFFGREKLLAQLADKIHRGEFLGVFGLRKMGKTSLVHQLRDEKLKDEAVAYIDLQASSSLILRTFGPIYWEIERELHARVSSKLVSSKIFRLAAYDRFSNIPFDEARIALIFSEDLRELLDQVAGRKIKGVNRVVIVLDELERILPIGNQSSIAGYIEFFSLLRGLAQTELYRGIISCVVVAANALISERATWEGRENPVFALFQPLFLPPFSETDTAYMVKTLGRGMSVYWEPAALSVVFSEMGGHPFLTRQFCSRLIRSNSKRPLNVTAKMVQDSLGPFIHEETDKFEQIVDLLHTYFPDEEAILEKFALKEDAEKIIDEKSLRHLIGYQLIDLQAGKYSVTPRSLWRWLRQRAGLEK